MEKSNNLLTYVKYIMSYFERMGCKENEGLFLLRTLRERVRRDGYNEEGEQILERIVYLLYRNMYVASSDYQYFTLTDKGYKYIEGKEDLNLNVYLSAVLDYEHGVEKLFQELWWMIGREETAPFYVTGPMYYNTIKHFIATLPSYSAYIQKRIDNDKSTSRRDWCFELLKEVKEDKYKDFLEDLSKEINLKYQSSQEETLSTNVHVVDDMIWGDEKREKKGKVFMSFVNEEIAEKKVTLLKNALEEDYEILLPSDITSNAESIINECDMILLILTPQYKKTADGKQEGEAIEFLQVIKKILNGGDKKKIIPLVVEGIYTTSYPDFIGMRNGIDFTDDESIDEVVKLLKNNIRIN